MPPQDSLLTVEQAADLLGVTLPTVMRCAESGELRSTSVDDRVRLSETLACREQRKQRQYAVLAATAVDIDDEDDPQNVLKQLREARRAASEQRRAGDR